MGPQEYWGDPDAYEGENEAYIFLPRFDGQGELDALGIGQVLDTDLVAGETYTLRVAVGDANRPPKGRYDVLVLDPPRQGARALFEQSGLLPGPKRVIYVSCDTATLARDLRCGRRLSRFGS